MKNILIHDLRFSDLLSAYSKGNLGNSILLQFFEKLKFQFPKLKFDELFLGLQYNVPMFESIFVQSKGLIFHGMKSESDFDLSSLSNLTLSKLKEDIKSYFEEQIGIKPKIYGPDLNEFSELEHIVQFGNKIGNVNTEEPRKFILYHQGYTVETVSIKNIGYMKTEKLDLNYLVVDWKFIFAIFEAESSQEESLKHFPENGDFFFSKPELRVQSYLGKRKIASPDYTKKILEIPSTFENVVTKSDEFTRNINKAKFYAGREGNILIRGDTGTGKELFANAIYKSSNREHEPFLAVNCASFTKEMLESHLFGHKKGAFTGAIADKEGILDKVDKGTLFLDEIGEIPFDVQPKLLRAIETGEYYPLGETNPKKSDFRLISATNKKIEDPTIFRPDLYFRISHFRIDLPTLVERGEEDIIAIAEFFSKKILEEDTSRVLEGAFISMEALDIMAHFAWPGNVRQLSHFITKLIDEALFRVIFEGTMSFSASGKLKIDETIVRELLAKEVSGIDQKPHSNNTDKNPKEHSFDIATDGLFRIDHSKVNNLSVFLSDIEKAYIESAIRKTGNQKKAAAMLGLKQDKISRMCNKHNIVYKELKKVQDPT